MKLSPLFLLLFLFMSMMVVAQQYEERLFIGNLLNKDTEKPVEFGAIKNLKSGAVILTDKNGIFEIQGAVGDTLRFHSLGYMDATWVIPGIWCAMTEDINLNVETSIYSIQEVEVLRFYSYAHFRQAFKDLKLPEDESQKVKEMVSGWDFDEAIAWGKADKKAKEGTFGLSFNAGGKSNNDKKRDEVKRLERIVEESSRFNYFTSRDNVANLTGYHGICLDSFMVFLNTNYSIHYKMPENELLTVILSAHDNFANEKVNEDWFILLDSINIQ